MRFHAATPCSKAREPGAERAAFTLIEVLVATAVLAIMLVLVASLINSASQSTRTTEGRLDTASMARIAFDRIGDDLNSLVWDKQITLVVGEGNNTSPASQLSDSLAFVCNSRGMAVPGQQVARMMAVFYAVNHHADNVFGFSTVKGGSGDDAANPLMLARGFRDIDWSAIPHEWNYTIDKVVNYGIADEVDSSNNVRAIGDGIIRMAVVAHLNDGSIEPVVLPDGLANPDLPSISLYDPSDIRAQSTALDLSRVNAITVGLAILDNSSKVLSADRIKEIAAALPRPGADELPVAAWQNINWDGVSGLNPAAAKAARENLRFYQRTFPIMVK